MKLLVVLLQSDLSEFLAYRDSQVPLRDSTDIFSSLSRIFVAGLRVIQINHPSQVCYRFLALLMRAGTPENSSKEFPWVHAVLVLQVAHRDQGKIDEVAAQEALSHSIVVV